MKQTTFDALYATIIENKTVDLADAIEDMKAERARKVEKQQEKAAAYDEAKPVVMDCLRGAPAPMTVKEIFDACEADLPDDFSTHKINYALRNYWADEVTKCVEGKVNTYIAK